MHESYFQWNSIAVCEIDSMETFFHAIEMARFGNSYGALKDLIDLYTDRNPVRTVKNPVARFLQLPKGYCRSQSACLYLGELAFKFNQDQGSV